MKYSTIGLLALLLSLSVVQAHAMPGSRSMRGIDPEQRFAAMDADSDARVVWEEFIKARPNFTRNAFDSIDKNRDGAIVLEEWKAFHSSHGGAQPSGDMSKMMKSMGESMKAPSEKKEEKRAMPLIMPPRQEHAPAHGMPLITPPAEGR